MEWVNCNERMPPQIEDGMEDGTFCCGPQDSVVAAKWVNNSLLGWRKARFCSDGKWRDGYEIIEFTPSHWCAITTPSGA